MTAAEAAPGVRVVVRRPDRDSGLGALVSRLAGVPLSHDSDEQFWTVRLDMVGPLESQHQTFCLSQLALVGHVGPPAAGGWRPYDGRQGGALNGPDLYRSTQPAPPTPGFAEWGHDSGSQVPAVRRLEGEVLAYERKERELREVVIVLRSQTSEARRDLERAQASLQDKRRRLLTAETEARSYARMVRDARQSLEKAARDAASAPPAHEDPPQRRLDID